MDFLHAVLSQQTEVVLPEAPHAEIHQPFEYLFYLKEKTTSTIKV